MVFWSCTLYQVNPECQRTNFFDLWAEEGQEYSYDTHNGDLMYVYVNEIQENSWGELIELQIDILSEPFHSRRRQPQRFIITENLALQLFRVSKWPSIMGAFGSQGNVSKFNRAVSNIYSRRTSDKVHPCLPVIFNLREREDCLTSRFPGMRALSVDQIRGIHVRGATIRGSELENSPYYEEWVLDSSRRGEISYFGLNVADETLYVGPFGTIYSRTGRENRPVGKVANLISRFLDCKAIFYQPELEMFT